MIDRDAAGPLTMRAKRQYTVRQTYRITQDAARTIPYFVRLRRRDRQLTERIMLAVTEVNGCALCAYGHTRLAVDAGLSRGEVRALLGGVADGVPDDDLAAVVFAQHYAAKGGRPEQAVWQDLVDEYGEEQALSVLGTARMIMCGNAYGIPWSSLLSRLRGAPDPDSDIGYEIGTIVGATLVMPVAVGHAGISRLRGKPTLPSG
jgi:AhpD family alkylhydroperoxidase